MQWGRNDDTHESTIKIVEITSKIEILAHEISEISDKVSTLRNSNNLIVDNVNTLSATTFLSIGAKRWLFFYQGKIIFRRKML